MIFQKGDKVKGLNEAVEGTVSKVEGKTVFVESDDGFDYPFPEDELIKVNEGDSIEFKSKSYRIEEDRWEKANHKAPEFVPKRNKKGVLEVDLHVQELIEKYPDLNRQNALQIQLQHAEKWLGWARQKQEQRIVFIHGVGEGTLKRELKKKFEGRGGIAVEDASYQLYGFGAMELFLKP